MFGVLLYTGCRTRPLGVFSPVERARHSKGVSVERLDLDGVIFPDSAWQRATPAERGIDPVLLDSALAYLSQHCGADGLRQTVVIKDGFLIYSGDNVGRTHNIYSCTKGLTSTCMLLLHDTDKVNLDDRAALYEPVLAKAYPDVTLWHLATMTSGYAGIGDSRWNEDSRDWGWTPYVPDKPQFAPGEAYAYWDEAQMMYGRVLAKAAGRDLYDILNEGLMLPIGIRDWSWGTEGEVILASGAVLPLRNGCTGITLDALELARVGWLFANRGVWAGDTLLSPKLVSLALSAQVDAALPVGPTDRAATKGPGVYGFGWWTASPNSGAAFAMPDAPSDAAYLSGLHQNVCYVVPSQSLVVVRMGEDGNPKAGKHVVWNGFAKRMSEAIAKGKAVKSE